MKSWYKILLSFFSVVLTLSSCVTQNKLTYLKYTEEVEQSVMSEAIPGLMLHHLHIRYFHMTTYLSGY